MVRLILLFRVIARAVINSIQGNCPWDTCGTSGNIIKVYKNSEVNFVPGRLKISMCKLMKPENSGNIELMVA